MESILGNLGRKGKLKIFLSKRYNKMYNKVLLTWAKMSSIPSSTLSSSSLLLELVSDTEPTSLIDDFLTEDSLSLGQGGPVEERGSSPPTVLRYLIRLLADIFQQVARPVYLKLLVAERWRSELSRRRHQSYWEGDWLQHQQTAPLPLAGTIRAASEERSDHLPAPVGLGLSLHNHWLSDYQVKRGRE